MISIAMFNYQRVMEISSEQTCGITMVILGGRWGYDWIREVTGTMVRESNYPKVTELVVMHCNCPDWSLSYLSGSYFLKIAYKQINYIPTAWIYIYIYN